VRPVEIAFAANPGPDVTVLLDVDGMQIRGECLSEAEHTRLQFVPTGNDGLLYTSAANDDTPPEIETQATPDFEGTTPRNYLTEGFGSQKNVALSYQSESGTTVTGGLQIAEGADIAPCVIAGTLFLG
jgi:hypothetical protein